MRSVEDRDYEEPGLLDVRPTDEEAPEPLECLQSTDACAVRVTSKPRRSFPYTCMVARVLEVISLEMGTFALEEGSSSNSRMVQRSKSPADTEDYAFFLFDSRGAHQDHR